MRSLHTYYARYLPQAAAAAVIPLILLVWVATQDWLSFVVVIALVLAVPVTMIAFGREATRRSERQWRRLGSLAGRVLQLVEGLPTLRAFGREAQGRREVEAATEGVRSATMRTLRVAFLSALSMDMIAGFGVGFVAMVLGLRLLWGELGLQTAMAVLLVAPEIFIPLRRAGAEFHASTEGQAAAARVVEVLATPVPDAATRPRPPSRPRPGRRDGRDGGGGSGLRIDGLGVRYDNRRRPRSTGVSLQARPGTRVALTGPSGCGQVDRAGRVAALRRAQRRHHGVRRARQHARRPPAAWREHFSWLPQRPHLFNATLAENLRLGAPDASDEDLRRVLDAVGLADLLANLPAGLLTAVGHDGLTLSSGERQRVALARALLRPAPVLLLDEPTAALDPPTVARLAPAIEPWLERAHGRGGGPRAPAPPPLRPGRHVAGRGRASRWRWRREPARRSRSGASWPSRARPTGAWPWPGCSVSPRRPRPSACWPGPATWSAAPRCGPACPRSWASWPRSRCWPSCGGPLRYAERLVGHDAALRALTRWRLWLYDCLTPRVPAALAGWRSGDLLARAIDDVDALQDLYLRTLLPVADRRGRRRHRHRRRRAHPPVGRPGPRPPAPRRLDGARRCSTWRRGGDVEVAALAGSLSAQVVDALAGAPELLAFGADAAFLHAVEELGERSDALAAPPRPPRDRDDAAHAGLPRGRGDGGAGCRRVRRARPSPRPGHGGRAAARRASPPSRPCRGYRWRWPARSRCGPRPSASSRSRTCPSR